MIKSDFKKDFSNEALGANQKIEYLCQKIKYLYWWWTPGS